VATAIDAPLGAVTVLSVIALRVVGALRLAAIARAVTALGVARANFADTLTSWAIRGTRAGYTRVRAAKAQF
jgi:hypothetical protein